MKPPPISTARRLEYAQGYLSLGMTTEAAAELEAICAADRHRDAVLELTIDLYSLQQDWDLAVIAAQEYARRLPEDPKGWIAWAFALRRLESIVNAEVILLQAEKWIGGSCALVHYNLACYRCQLGDRFGALQRLVVACRMEPQWKQAALEDPDLAPLKTEIAALTWV